MATIYWKINNGTLYIRGDSAQDYSEASVVNKPAASSWPWHNNRSDIINVIIETNISLSSMQYCFSQCVNLVSFTIQPSCSINGLSSMQSCFSGCTSFNQLVTIPSSVSNIGNCFFGCTSFNKSIIIPNNVRQMSECFSGCTSFNQSITIPSGVSMMNRCFYGCSSLNTTIIINSNGTYNDIFTNTLLPIFIQGESLNLNDIANIYSNVVTVTANCAEFDSTNGTLRIFHSTTEYTNGQTIGTKTYYTGIDQITGTNTPKWYSIRNNITKIIIEDLFKPKTGYCLFSSTSLTSIEFFKYKAVIEPNITNINLYYEYNSETETYFLTEDQTIEEKTYYTRFSIFDTSNITNMGFMFNKCQILTELDLSGFNTSNVTIMNSMFNTCYALTTLDLSGFDTSNVTNTSFMFSNCQALTSLDVSSFNTSNVTNMCCMFQSCYVLTTLDVSGFDTLNVTNMSFMFNQCYALTSLDVSDFDTSNVTNMNAMFQSCHALTTLDVSNFDTSNVTNMAHIFNECHALTTLTLSLSFNTFNVTDMEAMFQQCYVLTSLDVSHFDTSNVTNMSFMFNKCYVLASPLDVSDFNTSNVTDMSYMFARCQTLTSLDVSHFDTSNVTNMEAMFGTCYALASLDVSSFNTSNVTNMGYMFTHCHALTPLNVLGFNTSNVTNMSHMFQSCYALTSLDVSNFDTSKVTDMGNMFGYCPLLTTLDISNFVFLNSANINGMFEGCTSLAGAIRINSNPGSYTDMFKDTVEEIVLFGNSTLLNSFTTTANNHNVYVWSLSVQPRAERDKEVGDSVNFSVEVTRFAGNQGEIEIEATVNDVSVPLTWNEPLVMDTNRKTFTATLTNVDENASITYTFVVEDIYGNSLPRSITVPTNYYTIDFLKGGKEISFGEKADVDDLYEVLTTIPDDWASNYHNYYKKEDDEYISNTDVNFVSGNYYKKIHESLFKCGMDAVFLTETQLFKSMYDIMHPIGSYYESSLTYIPPSQTGQQTPDLDNPTSEDLKALGITWFNPNFIWSGRWELELAGQVHVSSGTGYMLGTVGGSPYIQEHSHSYTAPTLPAHVHGMGDHTHNSTSGYYLLFLSTAGNHPVNRRSIKPGTGTAVSNIYYGENAIERGSVIGGMTSATNTGNPTSYPSCGGSIGNVSGASTGDKGNMPPYIVVNRWHRVA